MARAHLLRSPIAGFAAISLAVLFTASLMNALWWVSLGGFTGLVAFELFTAFVLFYSLLAESAPSRGQ